MNVEINMINVEDGDAIILTLEKADNKALIIIDGGYKKHYKYLKKRVKELLPEFNNQISLIVCTHYDNDHLGGESELIEDYHDQIQEIWMHKAEQELQNDIIELKDKIKQIEEQPHQIKRIIEMAQYGSSVDRKLIIEGYK
jgi:beta-lactamase superfamily II metal-dependent hydrolase